MPLSTLHPTLLALEDTATPEVVRGVLSHVFDQLPEDARAREYGKILVDNAFNNVAALSLLDFQTLRFCEIPVAHCALILRTLSSDILPVLIAPTPAVLPGGLPGADAEAAEPRGSSTRQVKATAFAELGACGLPARGPFTAWFVAFFALLSPIVAADCVSTLSSLLTTPAAVLATVWHQASGDSATVWRVWLNAGVNGLPSMCTGQFDPTIHAICTVGSAGVTVVS